MEKRSQPRIRQTPKHMEKMLFVNHKEEQGLQRRLEAISSSSRIRGRELDRERIKVRNEWRYNSRINYLHLAPMLEQIPVLIRRDSHRPAETVDPVNIYLLREYRRNSQVIPSILSALSSDDESDSKEEQINEDKQRQRQRKMSVYKKEVTPDNRMSKRSRRIRADSDDSDDVRNEPYEVTDDNPDPSKVNSLVKDITKLRNEMAANKKIELMRSRITFQDLLRDVKEKEKQGSESDTYTDGTCALLRRKMSKMRNSDDSNQGGVEVTFDMGQGVFKVKPVVPQVERKRHSMSHTPLHSQKLPVLPAARSVSSVPTIGRQQALLGDSEADMKKQLEEQEKYQTEIKVAKEVEKYRRIQKRIGEFLEKNKRRAALPLIFDEGGNV